MAKQSQIRQNYHEECEALVNRQVNMELYASYVYLSLVRFVGEQQGEDKGEKEGRGAGEVEEERNILEANISGHILHPGWLGSDRVCWLLLEDFSKWVASWGKVGGEQEERKKEDKKGIVKMKKEEEED